MLSGTIYNRDECPLIFMPWFFFKSGMFYREKSLKETIYGGIAKALFVLESNRLHSFCISLILIFALMLLVSV